MHLQEETGMFTVRRYLCNTNKIGAQEDTKSVALEEVPAEVQEGVPGGALVTKNFITTSLCISN